jgi:hypothetical protein
MFKADKMQDKSQGTPIFRMEEPSADDLAAFHRDGYVAFPAVFSDDGLKGFLDEILSREQVIELLKKNDDGLNQLPSPYRLDVRPWNNKGPWSDPLFDAPLVTALLRAAIGEAIHFCHSTLHLSLRGCSGIRVHMDHHHWLHNNPVNLAERDKMYVGMLYYPNGFNRGDTNLAVVPGSHLSIPTTDRYANLEELLEGKYDVQAGREFKLKQLQLPPGSMVFLNGRTFHAVSPKPLDSPQAYRIFVNYIFKEAGPPHRFTQPIPPEWLESANPERQKLFQREPYAEGCWE